MAVDPIWNNVITGVVGFGSAGLLYWGARGQRAVELLKLDRDEHRQRRAARNALYVEYVTAVDKFKDIGIIVRNSGDTWAWWRGFEDVSSQIELFASRQVADAAVELFKIVQEIFRDGVRAARAAREDESAPGSEGAESAEERDEDEDEPLHQGVANAYSEGLEEFHKARKAVLDAMRSDLTDD